MTNATATIAKVARRRGEGKADICCWCGQRKRLIKMGFIKKMISVCFAINVANRLILGLALKNPGRDITTPNRTMEEIMVP